MEFKNKYYKRLYEEWQQHSKIIIAVDFDDTISPWRFQTPEDINEIERTMKIIIEAKQIGAFVVIFTACNKDRYIDIIEYCRSKGLEIDGINTTPVEIPHGYGKTNKIYANIFLDDRAGLIESLEMLEDTMYKIRAYKYSLTHRDEIG